MSQEQVKRLRKIYGIILSVLIGIVGICFIVSCISIYHSGDRPFSPEIVASYYSNISIIVYVCLAVLIGGIVLHLILPAESKAIKAESDPKLILERLHRRLDVDACSPEVLDRISRERRLRLILRLICTALCTICAIPVVLYLFTPGNFSAEADRLNGDLFSAILFSTCFFLDAAIFCIMADILEKLSRDREIAAVKAAINAGARLSEPRDRDVDWHLWGETVTRIFSTTLAILSAILFCTTVLRCNGFISADAVTVLTVISLLGTLLLMLGMTVYFVFLWKLPNLDLEKWGINILRVVIAVIAIVFIIAGILNGGMADVLAKAVRICTECIGLG